NFLKPDEVSFILADAEIDVVITDSSMAEGLVKLIESRPQLKFLKVELIPEHPENLESHQISEKTESELAVLIYTSGTTGRPKGAMLSHGNLLHNVESCRLVLETVEQDRFAVLLPLFHSYMLTVGLLLPLIVGGSLVLVKSLHQPRQILQEICQRQATVLPAIPAFYRTLIHAHPGPLPFRMC